MRENPGFPNIDCQNGKILRAFSELFQISLDFQAVKYFQKPPEGRGSDFFSGTVHSYFTNIQIHRQNLFFLYQVSPTQGYCGTLNAFAVTVTGKEVLLVFKSDTSEVKKGFNATAHFHITACKFLLHLLLI